MNRVVGLHTAGSIGLYRTHVFSFQDVFLKNVLFIYRHNMGVFRTG